MYSYYNLSLWDTCILIIYNINYYNVAVVTSLPILFKGRPELAGIYVSLRSSYLKNKGIYQECYFAKWSLAQ